jgi:hypothetical protein
MNISNLGNYFATENLIGRTNNQRNISGGTTELPQDKTSQPETIDMKNVSLDEINNLIKSGVEGLFDIVPATGNNAVSGYSSEYIASTKIDFLGQVEGYIKFQKNISGDTSRLESILENLKKIDGMKIPSSVNTIA